tara:strand:+ start:10239 stop:11258 length:1020 start_codon:yes stop_codon:yes gene_type:complete
LNSIIGNKKVLLLGGAGFVGNNLLAHLVSEFNYSITVADNFFRGKLDNKFKNFIEKNNIKLINADFSDKNSYSLLDNYYDQCYMLASIVGVENAIKNPTEVIRVNTLLAINFLEWVKDNKIGKIIYTSTSENYAGSVENFGYKIPTAEDVPLSISDITKPRFSYAASKILAESAFLNYSREYNFDCVILRYHNVYGPRMGFKHVIPNLVERFIVDKEEPFKMYGHNHTRSFCFVSDAIIATVRAMENSSNNHQIYHIGTEEEIMIEKLIKKVGKILNYSGDYMPAEAHSGSINRRCPDISKAERELSYKPQVLLKDGLKITIKWYKNHFENGVSKDEFG